MNGTYQLLYNSNFLLVMFFVFVFLFSFFYPNFHNKKCSLQVLA